MDSTSTTQPMDTFEAILSDGESRFLSGASNLFAGISAGRVPFQIAMQSLMVDLKGLRRHGFDADVAAAANAISAVANSNLPESTPSRISPSESVRSFADACRAVIDDARRNGVSFLTVVSTLAHDVGGLAEYDWNFERAASDCFKPKVVRWAERLATPFGAAAEPA